MAEKKKGKYQRCDECHGGYLIVFDCKDKRIRRSAVRGARKGLTERREGMRAEKEIRRH